MRNLISFTALTLLVAGCGDAPVDVQPDPAAEVPTEAAAPADAPVAALVSSSTAAADIQWKPANPEQPEGVQLAVVEGNPKEGAFTAIAKFPAGHAMPVHSHPANFAGVGLSGTAKNGRSADDSAAIVPGTVWTQPANEVHFTGCDEGAECLFVAHMDGAMGTTPAEAPMEGDLQMVVTAAADIPFTPVNPEQPEGPQMYVVAGDKAAGAFQAIVKFPAGAVTPEHSHSATYSAVVLSGAIGHGGDDSFGTGSHWTNIGADAHVTTCVSEEPCMFFVSMQGSFDMTPTAPPAEADAPAEAAAE